MITAKEARQLSALSFEEKVEEELNYAYDEIREAAERKRRLVYLTTEFWSRGGYDQTDEYEAAVKKLGELGFEAKFFYQDGQFATMYTIVKW